MSVQQAEQLFNALDPQKKKMSHSHTILFTRLNANVILSCKRQLLQSRRPLVPCHCLEVEG